MFERQQMLCCLEATASHTLWDNSDYSAVGATMSISFPEYMCLQIDALSLHNRLQVRLVLKFRLALWIWGRKPVWQSHSLNNCAKKTPNSASIGQKRCVHRELGIEQFLEMLHWLFSTLAQDWGLWYLISYEWVFKILCFKTHLCLKIKRYILDNLLLHAFLACGMEFML